MGASDLVRRISVKRPPGALAEGLTSAVTAAVAVGRITCINRLTTDQAVNMLSVPPAKKFFIGTRIRQLRVF